MILTASNIIYYLIDRGLVTPESVVDGDFAVVNTSRRNCNFKILRKNKPGYFVKQIQYWEPQAIATIQREATCYWLAQNDPDFTPLAALLPKYHQYDAENYTLTLELLPQGENISEYHRRLGHFPPEIATQLGKQLGTYHRQVGRKLQNNPPNSPFQRQIPWILQFAQQSNSILSTLNTGNSQLLKLLQKYPEFQQSLDMLQKQWRIDALIHGDIKWDNCILCSPDTQSEPNLKIVDWEMADFGDACWDVGAIFQAYLSFWLLSIPATVSATPAEMVEMAQYPLETMQPAIRSFWDAYLYTVQPDNQKAEELLERSMKYAAARMIQTAYEILNFSSQLTPNTLCMLQVSLNILKDPSEAIEHLLNLAKVTK
jgi:hypothetical protein